MSLLSLLNEIQNRKNTLVNSLFFDTVAQSSKINSERNDPELAKESQWEIYIFESFLIQLQEIKAADAHETLLIETQLQEIYKILSLLAKPQNYPHPQDPEALKAKQKNLAQHYLMEAIRTNQEALLICALNAGANVNGQHNGESPLYCAVKEGNYDMAFFLINNKAQINAPQKFIISNTPLLAAVRSNNLPLVQLLVQNGADINAKTQHETALSVAFRKKVSFALLHYLLSLPDMNRVDLSRQITRLLAHLETDYDYKLLKFLLAQGYKFNKEHCEQVLCSGKPALVDLMLHHKNTDLEGAKLRLKQHREYTELMYYVATANVEQVKILLASKTDLEAKNANYQTALMIAAELGRTEIAALLIQAGAEVNNTNCLGQSPIMLAVQQGHYETVRLLLENKADLHLRETLTFANHNALELAVEKKDAPLVTLLMPFYPVNTIDFAQGIQCANEVIAREYKIKFTEHFLLPKLNSAIEKQASILENNNSLWPLNLNHHYKAQLIEYALTRAKASAFKATSIQEYLNYKDKGQNSIMEALSNPRIGFFGETQSQIDLRPVIDALEKMPISEGESCCLLAN